jgi:beta-glucanase (GH16 family)
VDDFSRVTLPIDAREFHVYAADWTPSRVEFSVDGETIKIADQAPDYPMQLMLSIYEFPQPPPRGSYPKAFVVDYVRAVRPAAPRPR